MLSVDEAYEEVLRSGVWLERPRTLRLIRLTGPQRIWFLQNTVTADIENVGAGRWVESCFLDPKGRIQAVFRVGVLADEVWLDVTPDAATLAEWFERYRFRTKVEIETRERPSFTVLGSPARAVAADGEVRLSGDFIAFGYSLGDVPAADQHCTKPPEGTESPPGVYDVLRVEAGVGALGIDFTERNLPQEAGLTRTLSVDKGCYVGQETVARIHFRGHVNRVLRPLRFDDVDSAPGAKLRLKGEVIGQVTSVARSPRKGLVGLAMVRVEPPEGERVDVEAGGTAVLGPLPEGTKVKTT